MFGLQIAGIGCVVIVLVIVIDRLLQPQHVRTISGALDFENDGK